MLRSTFAALLVLGGVCEQAVAGDATALCDAISQASSADIADHPNLIKLGNSEVACASDASKNSWVCFVEMEEQCNPAGSVSDAGQKIKTEFSMTSTEVGDCFPEGRAKSLSYQRWISEQEGFVSNGVSFPDADPGKFVYVIQRAHGSIKNSELCLEASVKIEVEPPIAFDPFLQAHQ